MTLQRRFIPMDEDSQEYRLHNALFSTVHSLYRRDALECKDSTFILINSFVGRKASRGRIRLITGIYSVLSPLSRDLSSPKKPSRTLAKEKEMPQPLEANKGRGGSPLCLSLSVLATPSHGIIMLTFSLCPAYACKCPSRDHSDSCWELCMTMTMTPIIVGWLLRVFLPCPVLNSALRWEPYENST